MAQEDWETDVQEALRREDWDVDGPKRIVKVVPLGRAPVGQAGGYITLAKYVAGKTPQEMEADLGLPQGYLASGACIYSFKRPPMAHEYEYELTADHPGGLAYNPPHSSEDYPPGARHIHQWRIKEGAEVALDPAKTVTVSPGKLAPNF